MVKTVKQLGWDNSEKQNDQRLHRAEGNCKSGDQLKWDCKIIFEFESTSLCFVYFSVCLNKAQVKVMSNNWLFVYLQVFNNFPETTDKKGSWLILACLQQFSLMCPCEKKHP